MSDANKNMNGHIIGICLFLGLFIPHTHMALLLINPFLCVLLFFRFKSKTTKDINRIKFLFSALIIMSMTINTAFIYHASYKFILTGLNFLLLLFCFPFVSEDKIPNIYFYIFVSFIFLSQLIYLIHIPLLEYFIEKIYPIPETVEGYIHYIQKNIRINNVYNFRLSGIYYNPNQTGRYLCLITLAFLLNNHERKFPFYIGFLIITSLSILFTGSRTSMLVYSLIVFMFLWRNSKIQKATKLGVVAVVITAFVPLFFVKGTQYRGFDIASGIDYSALPKWNTFVDYLQQDNSVFHFIFGYANLDSFEPERYNSLRIFDSEFGNMFYSYGLLGFVLLLFFYFSVYKLFDKKDRIFFLILLWSITSSILLSYRMSFLTMLLMSHFTVRGMNSRKKVSDRVNGRRNNPKS